VTVVSDSSPIINLAAVNQLHLLQRLYSKVAVPQAVFEEVGRTFPAAFGSGPVEGAAWLQRRTVANRALVRALLSQLDLGEAEAIALAVEIGADLLLIDERRGRQIASRLGLHTLGLLGAVIEAKRNGTLERVKPVLDDLIAKAGFWVGEELYSRVLQEAGE